MAQLYNKSQLECVSDSEVEADLRRLQRLKKNCACKSFGEHLLLQDVNKV